MGLFRVVWVDVGGAMWVGWVDVGGAVAVVTADGPVVPVSCLSALER